MSAALRLWAGIGICVGAAGFLCVLLSTNADSRFVAPAVTLQAVILAALYFGRLSALIGSIAANLTLILFLFPPVGSVFVRDSLETAMLVLFQLASLVIVLISPDLQSRRSKLFPL